MSQVIRQRQPDNNEPFDFKQIFIGREEQLADFERVLSQWQQVMFAQEPTEDIATDIPSPYNKLQGLVVMLYGRGGFGKSTLLYRYLGIAKRANEYNGFTLCDPIEWDNAFDGTRRAAYNPAAGQSIDPLEYCKMLCTQLAPRLKKEPKDFRTFQQVAANVEKAKKDAMRVLEEVTRDPKDDRFKDIRGASIEVVATAVSSTIPGSKLLVDNTSVKSGANALVKLTGEQVQHLYQRFQHRLGDRLDYLLDPARRLAIALGSDLRRFALNHPLLIFFDTYEEIDEGDALLRVIMGAAGSRVSWVIAGRDNLWSGPGQRRRSIVLEHGYKEIVTLNRSLSVNFNSEDVGAFTASNVKEYFEQVCKLYPRSPRLSALTDADIQRILKVTNGIPLAVNIAAALYSETNDMAQVTEDVTHRKDMIDQMVARYLLHTRIDESERGKLYALAMLRRNTQRPILAIALGLSDEEAKTPARFDEALSHLHRRYSFIFTEQGDPSLHQEVRKYLRLWLLERRDQPDILAINEQLREAHQAALDKLEKQRNYTGLKDRLQDEEWHDVYLDLVEQQYWLNPVEGLRYLLPFMIVAAIYQRDINEAAADVGGFFASCLHSPYKSWWEWVDDSLGNTIFVPLLEVQNSLKGLLKLLEQKRLNAPLPFGQQIELETALCWRLGKAHKDSDERQALAWYEKALQHLPQDDLKEAAAEACCNLAYKLINEKKYAEIINLSTKAITLKHSYAWPYVLRGIAYYEQQQYLQAIEDCNIAIQLNPNYVDAYYERGMVYFEQQQYAQAMENYNTAIQLNPKDADYYYERAYAHLHLRSIEQAQDDFIRGAELAPVNINKVWMDIFSSMKKERPNVEVAERLETIAAIDPQSIIADICLAVALGLRGKLKEGLVMLEQALQRDPNSEDAYFWKGMLSAYYYRNKPQIAMEAIEKALELRLPPVLLTPLYWLQKDNPSFFEQYARPLLEQYGV